MQRIPCMSYSIVVGTSALEECASDLCPGGVLGFTASTRLVIISDTTVWSLHGPRLLAALELHSLRPLLRLLPPGEGAKTRGVKEGIEDWMLACQCLRDTCVLAFGGGVVGDLAGYVASTYMRGVAVVQLPTTLLAMVDSSIGGKTGLDVPAGKNLVGAFWQPRGVYADTALLATLPGRELCNGMAEVIKCGAIASAELFDLCEARAEELCAPGPPPLALLTRLIHAAAAIKAAVCTADEREGGQRATLNWGHTVGHGIEARMQPRLLHGECVAIGMVKEAEAARALGHGDSALVNRIKRVCAAYKLPTTVPQECASGQGLEEVLARMGVDKKNSGSGSGSGSGAAPTIKCVLVPSIGQVLSPPYAHAVPAHLLRRLLSSAVVVSYPVQQQQQEQQQPMRIRVPGSKSVSNRALLLAGLSAGTTRITGLLASDDTAVMLTCLGSIGARVRHEAGSSASASSTVVIEGAGGRFTLPPGSPPQPLYVQNAGTASRFLAGVLPLLPFAPGSGASVLLTGNARMGVRPIGPLVDALLAQGVQVGYAPGGKAGCLPLSFSGGVLPTQDSAGVHPPGPVPARRVIRLAAKLSSQYVSSILMAAPFFPPILTTAEAAAALAAAGAAAAGAAADPTGGSPEYTELCLEEEQPTSLPYILMTLCTMADFGVRVQRLGSNRFLVPRGPYTSPAAYDIEADASSASYPAAMAVVQGRRLELLGVGSRSTQGDAGFPLLLGRMGAGVAQGESSTAVAGLGGGAAALTGIACNMAEQTDCFMTLAAVAALATGTTSITGIANQRVKECNRILAMVTELRKLGVEARELEDGIEVEGCSGRLPSPAPGAPPVVIHCYDDHRIAMAFSILATAVPGGLTLDDAACVEKTFPEYWDVAEAVLGLQVQGTSLLSAAAPAGSSSASVLLIGMRGAGKSTLAVAGAAYLGPAWRAVDLDRELEGRCGQSVAGVIAARGWEGFRAAEAGLLAELLAAPATASQCVIACGGGVVESAAARAALQAWLARGNSVIEVQRSVQDIEEDLVAGSGSGSGSGGGGDSGRPVFANGQSFGEVYARRQAWYAACSSHSLRVHSGDRGWEGIQCRFQRLLQGLVGGQGAGGGALAQQPARFGPLGCPILTWPQLAVSVDGGWPSSSTEVSSATSASSSQAAAPSWMPWGPSDGSCFVCLALPSLQALVPASVAGAARLPALADALHTIALGAQAVELRVDCLAPCTVEHAGSSLSLLRTALQLGAERALRQGEASGSSASSASSPSSSGRVFPGPNTPLPIIFTLRSAAEGGAFAGGSSSSSASALSAALLEEGLRQGVEWVDLEMAQPGFAAAVARVGAVNRGGARVIASCHWPDAAAPPTPAHLLACATRAAATPGVAVVKLVVAAASPAAALHWTAVAQQLRASLTPAVPLIFLAMGEAGRLTRVLNPWLTPVTHPALPLAAAPGQLSWAQLAALRASLGCLRPRSYYLFGTPLAHSLSPAMHNAGLRALGLPHNYCLAECSSVGEVARILCQGGAPTAAQLVAPVHGWGEEEGGGGAQQQQQQLLLPHAQAGGGNVTMPHKVLAISLCTAITPEAAVIGAVNVLLALPSATGGRQQLYGANTDWLGVAWPIARRLHGGGGAGAGTCAGAASAGAGRALVIGAGGTARAAVYACKRLGLQVSVHNPRTEGKGAALALEFGCSHQGLLTGSGEGVWRVVVNTLPASLGWVPPPGVLRPGCIAMDVAYLPRRTAFLAAAQQAGCEQVVEGVEMLVTQGVASLALWLGVWGEGQGEGALPRPQGAGGLPVAEMARAAYRALERA